MSKCSQCGSDCLSVAAIHYRENVKTENTGLLSGVGPTFSSGGGIGIGTLFGTVSSETTNETRRAKAFFEPTAPEVIFTRSIGIVATAFFLVLTLLVLWLIISTGQFNFLLVSTTIPLIVAIMLIFDPGDKDNVTNNQRYENAKRIFAHAQYCEKCFVVFCDGRVESADPDGYRKLLFPDGKYIP